MEYQTYHEKDVATFLYEMRELQTAINKDFKVCAQENPDQIPYLHNKQKYYKAIIPLIEGMLHKGVKTVFLDAQNPHSEDITTAFNPLAQETRKKEHEAWVRKNLGEQDHAFMDPVIELLKTSKTGRYLLDFAKMTNVRILVADCPEGKETAHGFSRASCNAVVIFRKDQTTLEKALTLAHELRHNERSQRFNMLKNYGYNINMLVVSKLDELDAQLIESRVEDEIALSTTTYNPEQKKELLRSFNNINVRFQLDPKQNYMFDYEKKLPLSAKKLTVPANQKSLRQTHIMLCDKFLRKWFSLSVNDQYVEDKLFSNIRKWTTSLTPVGQAVFEGRASQWSPPPVKAKPALRPVADAAKISAKSKNTPNP